MPLRRPDAGSFEHLLHPVYVRIASMVRLSRAPTTELYWSRKARYRFDDAMPLRPIQFGVCHAASAVDVAFAESVLHDNALFQRGVFIVATADLRARAKIYFKHLTRTTLRLADLTGEHLKKLGLNNDISSSDDYSISQLWSRAIHDCNARWDGIRYVSRQLNNRLAYAIVERSGVEVDRVEPLDDVELHRLCAQFKIEAI